jgi:hypothetical protein
MPSITNRSAPLPKVRETCFSLVPRCPQCMHCCGWIKFVRCMSGNGVAERSDQMAKVGDGHLGHARVYELATEVAQPPRPPALAQMPIVLVLAVSPTQGVSTHLHGHAVHVQHGSVGGVQRAPRGGV